MGVVMAIDRDTDSRWRRIGLWVLVAALAALFAAAGASKLAGLPMHVENFARWGYPGWFMYVTGAVELAGAAALVLPRVSSLGAVLLGCTMIGAVITHLVDGEGPAALPAAVLFVLLVLSGFARRAPILRDLAALRGVGGDSG